MIGRWIKKGLPYSRVPINNYRRNKEVGKSLDAKISR